MPNFAVLEHPATTHKPHAPALLQGVFKPSSQGVTHSLAAAGGVPGSPHADPPAVDMRPLADSANVYACVFPGLHSHDAATSKLSNSLAQTLGGVLHLYSTTYYEVAARATAVCRMQAANSTTVLSNAVPSVILGRTV
jgi:hypothetical protein